MLLDNSKVDALRQAAISAFPTVAAMRGYLGRDNAPRRDDLMSQRGRGLRQDRGRGRGRFAPGPRAFRINEAGTDDDDDYEADSQDDSFEDHPTRDLDPSLCLGDGDGEGDDSDLPEEAEAAARDSEAFVTQAKKQRARVEQARGFSRKGYANPDPGARAEHLNKLKARMARAACGQLGHWRTIPRVQRSRMVNVVVIGTTVAIGP